MKWHVEYYQYDKTRSSSEYFRTQKEAQWNIDNSINRGHRGFPIGDKMAYTEYRQLPGGEI